MRDYKKKTYICKEQMTCILGIFASITVKKETEG